jgi:poly-beta-1,6-N-acetyl-D-glucosamine biosynthesis protein PgaD
VLDAIFTLLLWAGYFYLMRHVLSVALSYFGVPAPWGLQYGELRVADVLQNLRIYAVVIIINATVFAEWALYNQVKFGRRDRRRRSEPITPSEMAVFFDLTPDQVTACQAVRHNVMVHDDAGHLTDCDAFKKLQAAPGT